MRAKVIYFLGHGGPHENKMIAVVPGRYSKSRIISTIQDELKTWKSLNSIPPRFNHYAIEGGLAFVALDEQGINDQQINGLFVVEQIEMIGFKGDVQ